MFKRIGILLLIITTAAVSFQLKKPGKEDYLSLHYADMISMDTLSYIIDVLASDSLEGRETGTPGELKAAYFLAMLHVENGVMPYGDEYFQEYEVIKPEVPDVVIATDRETYHVGTDFLSLFPHDSTVFSDDHIIYVGYGIDDPSWNDYAYKDVKGKIVLVKEGEPTDMFGIKILTATERPSEWSADPIHAYILKRNAAIKHGAKAMLYYAPRNFKLFQRIYKKIYKNKTQGATIKKDTLYDFIIGQKIMEDITGYDNLDTVYYTGRKDRKWLVPVTIDYGSKNVSLSSQNIIAFVEGKEEADEIILITTNYDHLGKEDSLIYHGANNNGSGSAALIEIAKAFQKAADDGYFMKRSLMFVHFSGREKNHYGAKYFMKKLPVPKHKIKAVIDIDMIGFLDTLSTDPSVVYMANSLHNKKFFKRLKSVNKAGPKLKIKFLNHKRLFSNEKTASDGVLFYKEKFPVLTFNNTALYPYNRTPDDTPDKISWDTYKQRVKYIFMSAWLLANE
jgi:hypothetical protein